VQDQVERSLFLHPSILRPVGADQSGRGKREYLRAYTQGINIAAAAALITDLCIHFCAGYGRAGVLENRERERGKKYVAPFGVSREERVGKSFFLFVKAAPRRNIKMRNQQSS
jgi:hypothetical protein